MVAATESKERASHLTPKQKAFADALLSGAEQSEAYRLAYNPHGTPSTTAKEAYRLAGNPKVAEYLAGQRLKQDVGLGLTRAKKRQILKEIAEDPERPARERLMAISIDNLMTGDNKPVRIEGEITLNLIYGALKDSTGLPEPGELEVLDEMTADGP